MSNDWNWQGIEENESTVVKTVRAVAVYTNSSGDVVIRQEGYGYGDNPDDQVVIVPNASIGALVKALKEEAKRPRTPG